MATIVYNRDSDTAATTLTGIPADKALTVGVALYREGEPDRGPTATIRNVVDAARSGIHQSLHGIHVRIIATPAEVQVMERVAGDEITRRSVEFVARMNAIEDIEERADAIIAARNRW